MLRIKHLRQKHKIMQKKMAVDLGIGKSTLSQYENGLRQPDFDTLCKIANYFNVTVDYILGNDIKKTSPLSEDNELAELLQEPVVIEIMETLKKLTPERQKVALAQLEALANLEENLKK